jgi:hypothetical protein
MTIRKINTDKVIRRLRCVVLLFMLVDGVVTLMCQPAVFWSDPRNALEGDPVVRFFLIRGVIPYAIAGLIYVVCALFITSILPRRIGLALLFFLLLEHFWAATVWLTYFSGTGFRSHAVVELCVAVLVTLSIYPAAVKRSDGPPNKITGANAVGPPLRPMGARWAARIAQFRRSPA